MSSIAPTLREIFLEREALRNEPLKTAVGVGTFAVLTALGAHVILPLPFTPVPVTLQTLFVLLSGAVLGWRGGAASQILYLAAGAAGAPVFALGASGPLYFFGPTAGYLLAFPLAAAASGWTTWIWREAPVWIRASAYLACSLGILMAGSAWLSTWTGGGIGTAMMMGILPFLPGAAIKALCVAGAAPGISRRWRGGTDSAGRD